MVFAVVVTACGQAGDSGPATQPAADATIVVTAADFELLGMKFHSIEDLAAAVDANTQTKFGVSIAEEKGCVSEARVIEVINMLKQRKHADVSFVGHSTVLDADGRKACAR